MMRKTFLVSLTILLPFISIEIVIGEEEYNYARKEIMSFTWGTGEYQLGSDYNRFYDGKGNYIGPDDAASGNIGPGSMKINSKCEIYIRDDINARILKYSPNGVFLKSFEMVFGFPGVMAFDEKDKLYIEHNGNFVEILSSDLEELRIVRYEPVQPVFAVREMVVNEDEGILYLAGSEFVLEIRLRDQPVEREIDKRLFKFQPSKVVERKLIEELERDERGVKIRITSLKSQQQKLIKLKSEEHTRRRINKWIGEDKYGNTFLEISSINYPYTLEQVKEIVNIYNSDGELLSRVTLDRDDRLFFDQEYLVDIDGDGNIYHLWVKKDGARLIRWER